jgi:hypothetical protein
MSDRWNSKGDGEDLGPDLSKLLVWILAAALVFMLVVLAIYLVRFGTSPMSDDPEAWGQFGDFMGGTLNPLFAFLTLVAVTATITLQFRQLAISANELRLSRQELEETRNELKRSADAQQLLQRASRAQALAAEATARLAAISALLEHTRTELQALRTGGPTSINSTDAHARLMAKYQMLATRLEEEVNQITRLS